MDSSESRLSQAPFHDLAEPRSILFETGGGGFGTRVAHIGDGHEADTYDVCFSRGNIRKLKYRLGRSFSVPLALRRGLLIRRHRWPAGCEATGEFGAAAAWHCQRNEDRASALCRSRAHGEEHARHQVMFWLGMPFAGK